MAAWNAQNFLAESAPIVDITTSPRVTRLSLFRVTQLNNRYIVGVALFVNGEGITYLAYDQSIGCKVYLREYMPPNLCNRVAGSPVISVIPARLAQYKGADGGIHGTAQIAGTPAWTGTR